jgi:ComF family protein
MSLTAASARRSARALLARAADIVLPPRCSACFARTATHRALCAACWGGLPLIERPYCERLGIPFAFDHGEGMLSAEAIAAPPAYGRARAAVRYDGIAVDLVHRLKYGDRVDLAPLMGRLMARAGADILAHADVLVPVPLHRLRLWRRRFNQAALLAWAISDESGVAHDPFLLVRRRRTAQQVGLTRQERTRNVQGAFAIADRTVAGPRGRRIVLVDDVVTTGATIEAAARCLLRAGASNVDVLSFARVCGEASG